MGVTMRIKSISNFATLFLAIAGSIAAIVLTIEEFAPNTDIGCSRLGGDCSRTINSEYGHLGPIPTSLFGLGMYFAIGGICVLRALKLKEQRRLTTVVADSGVLEPVLDPETDANALPDADDAAASDSEPAVPLQRDIKRLDGAVWGIALAGTLISCWLQYTSLFVINSFCPWCFSSAIIVTVIFLTACYDFLIQGRSLDGEQKMLAGITVFILVGVAVIVFPVVTSRIAAIKPLPNAGPRPVPVTQRELLLTADMATQGDKNAQYTLVEFADYQCPHCQLASVRLAQMIKNPPKPLRLAFRNFPLDNHQWAKQAAAAAEAAAAQGKFWEMHDLIFAHQKDMESNSFKAGRFSDFARDLGLDVPRFEKDMETDKITKRIAQDHVAADVTGLTSTPTFYLVTPTQITVIPKLADLEAIWKNPKDKAWN